MRRSAAALAAVVFLSAVASACSDGEAARVHCGGAGASCPTTTLRAATSIVTQVSAPTSTLAPPVSAAPVATTTDPTACESIPIPAFNLGGVTYTARHVDDAVAEADLGEVLGTQLAAVPEGMLRCQAVTLKEGEGSLEQGADVYAIRGVDRSIAIAAPLGTGYVKMYAP